MKYPGSFLFLHDLDGGNHYICDSVYVHHSIETLLPMLVSRHLKKLDVALGPVSITVAATEHYMWKITLRFQSVPLRRSVSVVGKRVPYSEYWLHRTKELGA